VQDLVIALDGSGAVPEGGFNTMRNLKLDMLAKYVFQIPGDEGRHC